MNVGIFALFLILGWVVAWQFIPWCPNPQYSRIWQYLESKSLKSLASKNEVIIIWISSNEMDKTGAHYTEWSKPER